MHFTSLHHQRTLTGILKHRNPASRFVFFIHHGYELLLVSQFMQSVIPNDILVGMSNYRYHRAYRCNLLVRTALISSTPKSYWLVMRLNCSSRILSCSCFALIKLLNVDTLSLSAFVVQVDFLVCVL